MGVRQHAGDPGSSPARWPVETRLVRAADRPTLVLLAHPQCSCTRASLGELAEVLARTSRRPKTYVVFLKPSGFPRDWEKTDLWRTAASLPDVTVVRDDEGMEAARFGASTSGQTVVYDSEGELLFSRWHHRRARPRRRQRGTRVPCCAAEPREGRALVDFGLWLSAVCVCELSP